MIKDPDELKDFIVEKLEEKKAEDVTVMELSDEVPIAKYLVFASGRSIKNVSAIADFVSRELKHTARRKMSIEGLNYSNWVLIDVGDVIVHVFHPEAREHFNLEDHWKNKSKD